MINFSTKYALILFFLNLFISIAILNLSALEELYIPVWIEISSIAFSFLLFSSFSLPPIECCNECCGCDCCDEDCRTCGYCNGEFVNICDCFNPQCINEFVSSAAKENGLYACCIAPVAYVAAGVLFIASIILLLFYYIINLMIIEIGKVGTRCISVIILGITKIAIVVLIILFQRDNLHLRIWIILGLSGLLIILNVFGLIIFLKFTDIKHIDLDNKDKSKKDEFGSYEPAYIENVTDSDEHSDVPPPPTPIDIPQNKALNKN